MRPITSEQLDDLRHLRGQIKLAEAELDALRASFNLAIAKLFVACKADQDTDVLCLRCGSFAPRGNGCPCRVKAKIPNPAGRLKPGMFGNLELVLGVREDALVTVEATVSASTSKRASSLGPTRMTFATFSLAAMSAGGQSRAERGIRTPIRSSSAGVMATRT